MRAIPIVAAAGLAALVAFAAAAAVGPGEPGAAPEAAGCDAVRCTWERTYGGAREDKAYADAATADDRALAPTADGRLRSRPLA